MPTLLALFGLYSNFPTVLTFVRPVEVCYSISPAIPTTMPSVRNSIVAIEAPLVIVPFVDEFPPLVTPRF